MTRGGGPATSAGAFRWSQEVLAAEDGGEDAARVLTRGEDVLVLVVDGAGGIGGGREAAEHLLASLDQAPESEDEAPWELLAAEWLEGLDHALAAGDALGEAAAVVLRVRADEVRGASAGDCAARLAAGPGDRWLTGSQRRQRLGTGRAEPVPFREVLGPDDVLVVATDGLWKYTDCHQVSTRARAGARAGELAAMPRLSNGALPDDVAVVVVRPRLQGV